MGDGVESDTTSKFEAQSMQSVTEIPIISPPQRSQFGKLFFNSGQFPDSVGSFTEKQNCQENCWVGMHCCRLQGDIVGKS